MEQTSEKQIIERINHNYNCAIKHCGEGMRICDELIEKTKNGLIKRQC